MATKVNIDYAQVNEGVTYPYIGVNKITGLIVWFYRRGHGVVLASGNSGYQPAFYWSGGHEINFEPFHGTITLQNE